MYHISPTTGNPNQCSAKAGNCPFGADQEHFETKAEAREAFEKSHEKNSLPEATTKVAKKPAVKGPLAKVANGAFPLDEARDLLDTNAQVSLKKVAEAAFASTFDSTDEELKELVFDVAETRGEGMQRATFNEYVDYADLVETVRRPTATSSISEPKTEAGRAVVEAKNPLSQAFFTFRGKTEVDPVIARDVLEQTFPNAVSGLSDESREKAFVIARDRADTWTTFVEEYQTAVDIASMAKSAPKRESASRLPRNADEAVAMIDTREKAEQFIKDSESYIDAGGENVRATVYEITAELEDNPDYRDLFSK
jgi:hypothetical protein